MHLENQITAITVMLADVSCINFHSFVLGVLSDGKQKNITLSDGVYTISTNLNSFQVSARPSDDKFQSFERGPATSVGPTEIGLLSVKSRDLTLAREVVRNVKNPYTVCKYLGIIA